MDRERVLSIRDRYSKSYNQYIADCKAGNHKIGDTFKKSMGTYDVTIEPPMWVSSEEEAWKKTLVKQAYKVQQNKTPRMKSVDKAIENNEDEEIQDINYNVVDEPVRQIIETQPEARPEPQPTTPDLGDLNEAF